jgi:hypothetical protein
MGGYLRQAAQVAIEPRLTPPSPLAARPPSGYAPLSPMVTYPPGRASPAAATPRAVACRGIGATPVAAPCGTCRVGGHRSTLRHQVRASDPRTLPRSNRRLAGPTKQVRGLVAWAPALRSGCGANPPRSRVRGSESRTRSRRCNSGPLRPFRTRFAYRVRSPAPTAMSSWASRVTLSAAEGPLGRAAEGRSRLPGNGSGNAPSPIPTSPPRRGPNHASPARRKCFALGSYYPTAGRARRVTGKARIEWHSPRFSSVRVARRGSSWPLRRSSQGIPRGAHADSRCPRVLLQRSRKGPSNAREPAPTTRPVHNHPHPSRVDVTRSPGKRRYSRVTCACGRRVGSNNIRRHRQACLTFKANRALADTRRNVA